MTQIEPHFPPYFSWVIEGFIAALAFPNQPEHMQYLVENKIKYLVSLTAERTPNVHNFPEIIHINIPVVDFKPPTLEQVDQFIKLMDNAKKNGEAVALHCAAGRGRTGTMIACFLVKEKKMSSLEAIAETRLHRPGSIETPEQEQVVHDYYNLLNQAPFCSSSGASTSAGDIAGGNNCNKELP